MSFSTRSLIDSAIKSCLEEQVGRSSHIVFSSSPVKTACLKLVSTCVVTPWPDGATTSLLDLIRDFAQQVASDVDGDVAMQARACLQLIRTMNTPRAPPLLFVTRSSAEKSTNSQDDAATVVERLQAVQEAIKRKDPVDETPTKKSKRKREKKVDETDPGKLKRTKVETTPAVEQTGAPEKKAADVEQVVLIKDETPTLTDDTPADPKAGKLENKVTEKVTDVARIEEADDDDDELDFMPGIVDDGPDYE